MRCLPKDVPQLRAKINLLGISKALSFQFPARIKAEVAALFFCLQDRADPFKKKELCVR